jgi:hypothetical protein
MASNPSTKKVWTLQNKNPDRGNMMFEGNENKEERATINELLQSIPPQNLQVPWQTLV